MITTTMTVYWVNEIVLTPEQEELEEIRRRIYSAMVLPPHLLAGPTRTALDDIAGNWSGLSRERLAEVLKL